MSCHGPSADLCLGREGARERARGGERERARARAREREREKRAAAGAEGCVCVGGGPGVYTTHQRQCMLRQHPWSIFTDNPILLGACLYCRVPLAQGLTKGDLAGCLPWSGFLKWQNTLEMSDIHAVVSVAWQAAAAAHTGLELAAWWCCFVWRPTPQLAALVRERETRPQGEWRGGSGAVGFGCLCVS